MAQRLGALVLAASIAAAVGCDSATPTSASPVAAEVQPTHTLTGVVSRETGNGVVPLEGARVETANGCLVRCPNFTTTDREGFYRLAGLQAINTHITISRWATARS